MVERDFYIKENKQICYIVTTTNTFCLNWHKDETHVEDNYLSKWEVIVEFNFVHDLFLLCESTNFKKHLQRYKKGDMNTFFE